MVNRLGLLFTLVGLVVASATATARAQQPPGSIGEPPECARARQLWAERRFQEGRTWQVACQEKRRQAAISSPRPGAPVYPTPTPASRAAPAGPPSGPPADATALAPAPPGSWAAELPSVEDVRAGIHGTDAADTTARQQAAFHILQDCVHTHLPNLPPATRPAAARRSREYFDADLGWSVSAERYSKDSNFQSEVLTKWLSDERKAHEVVEATRNSLAGDLKNARSAQVDLSVFGIPLGEQVTLPECPESASSVDTALQDALIGPTTPTTCMMKPNAFAQQMAPIFARFASAGPPGFVVRLARSACPDWLSAADACAIVLDVQDGFAVGASFTTRGTEQETRIVQSLSTKYPRVTPARGQRLQCQNTLTGAVTEDAYERHWQLPGLYVSYSPLGGCPNTTVVSSGGAFASRSTVVQGATQGKVTIELQQVRNLRSAAQQRREVSEPKL